MSALGRKRTYSSVNFQPLAFLDNRQLPLSNPACAIRKNRECIYPQFLWITLWVCRFLRLRLRDNAPVRSLVLKNQTAAVTGNNRADFGTSARRIGESFTNGPSTLRICSHSNRHASSPFIPLSDAIGKFRMVAYRLSPFFAEPFMLGAEYGSSPARSVVGS